MKLTLGLLALIAQVAGAAAQVPPSTNEAATHAAQDGIPGFLDPDTNTFTPLAPKPFVALPTREGEIWIHPFFSFNPSIHEFDSVLCTVEAVFGNYTGYEWYPNHTARATASFTAGIPDFVIKVPWTYTPNSDKAEIFLTIRCKVTNSAGTEYFHEEKLGTAKVEDGILKRGANMPL